MNISKRNFKTACMTALIFLSMTLIAPLQSKAAQDVQQTIVTAFITPVVQEVMVSEKGTIEEVNAKLPEVLEALDEKGERIFIPVQWECTGDYEGTNYYYYQFLPVIEREQYEISIKAEIPYIWVVLQNDQIQLRNVTNSTNETKIYQFLIDELDCNFATALGILANIERESSFNPKAQYPASGEASYYGICQWGSSRLADLKQYCSDRGYAYDSLEGQLMFLKQELYGTEARAWSKMQGIEDTAEGAYLAGYNWAKYFERCASVYYEVSAKRARDVYWPEYAVAAPVDRISGADRYETGLKIADQLKTALKIEKFDHIIIATGKSYADALSGSYLAYVKNAPVLLTNGKNIARLKQYIEKNLKSGGNIYLLGGEAAVSQEVEMQLSGYKVRRLLGKSRYETNLEILKEAGGETKELLICTGKGFADSLSASAAGRPILLVSNGLKESQKVFLENAEIEKIYIIGGENAVDQMTEEELNVYGPVSRIAGRTRYETSVMVAEAFVKNAEMTVLAYSKNFPDGLCAGALASALKAPLILTNSEQTAAAGKYINTCAIDSGLVIGGSKLISDDAVRKIFQLKVSDRITVY